MLINEIIFESVDHMHIMQELQTDIKRLTDALQYYDIRVSVNRVLTETESTNLVSHMKTLIWWDEFRCSTDKLKKTLAKRNALILQLEEKIKSGL